MQVRTGRGYDLVEVEIVPDQRLLRLALYANRADKRPKRRVKLTKEKLLLRVEAVLPVRTDLVLARERETEVDEALRERLGGVRQHSLENLAPSAEIAHGLRTMRRQSMARMTKTLRECSLRRGVEMDHSSSRSARDRSGCFASSSAAVVTAQARRTSTCCRRRRRLDKLGDGAERSVAASVCSSATERPANLAFMAGAKGDPLEIALGSASDARTVGESAAPDESAGQAARGPALARRLPPLRLETDVRCRLARVEPHARQAPRRRATRCEYPVFTASDASQRSRFTRTSRRIRRS